MRILHVYKSYYPETTGGVEQVIHTLCTELPKRNHQSDVAVCVEKPHDAFTADYQVFTFPTTFSAASCPISISFFKDFKKLTETYDLIHYHFPWPFADFMQIALQIQKPYIVSYHSDIIKQRFSKIPYTPLMHYFLKGATKIIASSPNYLSTSPVLQKHIDKVTCIPYGLSPEAYPPATPSTLERWEKKVGRDFFLFIGVLRYYKGLEYLIRAAQHTDAQIVIAGSGPERAVCEALALKLNVRNVTFLGYVSDEDKCALLSLCKAFVAPSHLRSEAFCISILEALMYNKPAISTEIGTGTSFVNQQGKTGIVVPPENPQALADAINVLKSDDVCYKQLQSNIPAHVDAQFTVEKMVEGYLKVYAEG